MPKTLNELAGDLKQLIIDLQSDAHNSGNIRMERYNNLKLLMFPQKNRTPHVIVDLSMSAAEFDIQSGQKINGSLGPDERYVLRWFNKTGTLFNLQETWKTKIKKGGEEDDI